MAIPGDFGLNFNVPIWHANTAIDHQDLLNSIMRRRVDNQAYLRDYTSDIASTTWVKENVFAWPEPCWSLLASHIRVQVEAMRADMCLAPAEELWINGWVNVMRGQDYLVKHCHATHTNCYLSGVWVASTCENSATEFLLPQFEHLDDVGPVRVPNRQGDIILFPQWLFHQVAPIKESLRITVGFDINTRAAMDYYQTHQAGEDLPISRAIPF
jgi:hypothetical protein